VYAQSIYFDTGYALAQELLQLEEFNPIHKAECEEFLKAMNSMLTNFIYSNAHNAAALYTSKTGNPNCKKSLLE
tara:strand:- start:47 stop:268 length:222 start_codon:yes stop_codon:yes gene_type:complete